MCMPRNIVGPTIDTFALCILSDEQQIQGQSSICPFPGKCVGCEEIIAQIWSALQSPNAGAQFGMISPAMDRWACARRMQCDLQEASSIMYATLVAVIYTISNNCLAWPVACLSCYDVDRWLIIDTRVAVTSCNQRWHSIIVWWCELKVISGPYSVTMYSTFHCTDSLPHSSSESN